MVRPFPLRQVLLTIGLAVLSVLILASCSTPQTTFDPQSDAASRIDTLYWLIIWAAILVGLGVLGALAYILFRFRDRPGAEALQIHGSTPLEISWTLLPIAVLIVIAIPTILAIAGAAREPDDNALHVRAIGHQWWFEFEYEGLGPDGGPLVTANELYLPVGRQVSITLESVDVIHSFWVPQLLGKTDMIPNRVNRLEPFTPNEIDTYYGQCAEFCGLAHAQMRFRTHVVSLGEFGRWVDAMNAGAAAPEAGTAEASGFQVFMLAGGCAGCHTIQGTDAQGQIGPDLTLFGDRTTVAAGILPNTEENLRDWISNVRAVKALPDEGSMPTFNTGSPEDILTEQQVADVAAYLRSLRMN